MPSTLLGLVVFVVSLAPGLVFVLLRERVAPQRVLSVFRETSVVICVSLAADAVVLMIFGVLRAALPTLTPDVGQLIRTPTDYLRASYVLVSWWSLGLLVLATGIAGLVGSGALRRGLSRLPRSPVSPVSLPHEAGVSAWWLAFRNQPGSQVHVGCVLTDGSFVSGWLLSFSNQADDIADRDLTLASPIKYRPAGCDTVVEQMGVGSVVVAARQIALIFVSYVVEPESENPAEVPGLGAFGQQ